MVDVAGKEVMEPTYKCRTANAFSNGEEMRFQW
jgi:hypothetical protein